MESLFTACDREIDQHLRGVLDRLFDAEGMNELGELIQRYVLAGGKRLRPRLCVWTYRQAIGEREPLPPALLDLACAWELFHAFLLVHDDIIDGSEQRRGRPSLHRQLASLDSDSLRFGTNLGIVAGDLLFGAAMRLCHEAELPDTQYRGVLKLFSRIACITGFGQAIDICQSHVPPGAVSEQTLLREYAWKTAAYTFEGPMLTGAIVAGLDKVSQAAIARYAQALGQAYQLQNDLADLGQHAAAGCDLMEGKRTVTLLQARATLGGDAQREFDRRLASASAESGPSVALAEALRTTVVESGAIAATRTMIGGLMDGARSAAAEAGRVGPSLTGMLDVLKASYFRA